MTGEIMKGAGMKAADAMAGMTAARFEALAAAWGGDIRRWPEAEREAARRFRLSSPRAEALLAGAGVVDALLDAAPLPAVSAELRARVLASAPSPRRGGGLLGRLRRQSPGRASGGRLAWTLGAGWAATACAGVFAGIVATHYMTADLQADAVLYQAGLAPVDDTEVLG